MPDFEERMDFLIDRIGDGHLVGSVTVDQAYAQYQHEGLQLNHPEGGRAKFLGGPLLESSYQYMQALADTFLTTGPQGAMIKNMEDLSQKVYDNAPREFNDLRASGHPIVTDDGMTIYNRAPMVHRLSADELRAKNQLRALGLGNTYGTN